MGEGQTSRGGRRAIWWRAGDGDEAGADFCGGGRSKENLQPAFARLRRGRRSTPNAQCPIENRKSKIENHSDVSGGWAFRSRNGEKAFTGIASDRRLRPLRRRRSPRDRTSCGP